LVDASRPRPLQQPFRVATPYRFCSHPVLSGTIKKRESFVPETIKKRLESYPGWSDLVRRQKKRHQCLDARMCGWMDVQTKQASIRCLRPQYVWQRHTKGSQTADKVA